jgi:opacity protein-like surface antigen
MCVSRARLRDARTITILLAVLLLASAAAAQPAVRVIGGYLYAHPGFEDVKISTAGSLNGWSAGADISVRDHLGVLVRTDGLFGGVFRPGFVIRPLGDEMRSTLYTVTAGPRVSMTSHDITVFADALFGMAHGRARSMGIDFLSAVDDTKFVGGVGGGVQTRVTALIGVEADVQYRRTSLFNQTLNIVEIGAGVVVTPRKR